MVLVIHLSRASPLLANLKQTMTLACPNAPTNARSHTSHPNYGPITNPWTPSYVIHGKFLNK